MIKQIGTWKLRWKILTLVVVLLLGAVTLTDAREKKPKKSAAELQAKIDKLQKQLEKVKEAEKGDAIEDEKELKVYKLSWDLASTVIPIIEARMADSQDVQLVADRTKNTLVVFGGKAAHEVVEKVLFELEEKEKEKTVTQDPKRIWGSYLIPATNSEAMFSGLRSLVPNVQLIQMEQENRFYVFCNEAEHKKIAKVLAELEESEERTISDYVSYFMAYPLTRNPEEVLPLVKVLLSDSKDVRLVIDEGKNMLLVYCRRADHEKVREMLEVLEKVK